MPPRPQQQKKLPQLNHKLGALLAFGVLGVVVFGAIQVFGDPSAAGPRRVIALNPSTASAEAAPRVAFSDVAAGTELEPLDYDPAAPEGLGSDPLPDSETPGELRVALVETPGAARPAASSPPLPRAPLAGLTEPGPNGPLPVISRDGRAPSAAYARPFTADATKPSVAVIIGGLGFNARATTQAIDELPAEITLSFVPYAEGLQGWIDMARAHGHEVLLEAPMEPVDYPDNDPGPYTLMADGQPQETTQRLQWLLSRATGYFGVTNYLGSKFVNSPAAMGIFENELKQRGLAFIDDGSASRVGGGLPRASADRIVDDQLDGGAIDAQLGALETQATRNGQALRSGFAYPITLQEAAHWAAGLGAHGVQLVPASALATRR